MDLNRRGAWNFRAGALLDIELAPKGFELAENLTF